MRHRRWVLVLAVFLLAVLPLAFLGLRIASRSPAVKRAILSRVIPDVVGELSIGELEIGLGSLEFGDVTIELADGGFISVPSAVVSVSLPRLLLSRMTAERALSSVIVTDPRIVVSYGAEPAQDEGRGEFDVSYVERHLPQYFGVSNATVVFRDVRTGRSLTVHSVDFLLERTPDRPAVGEAVGSVMGGEGNLSAAFTWDGESRTLSVEGALSETRLEGDLPIPPAVPVEIGSGVLVGGFSASVSPDSIRGLDLSFSVSDASLAVTSAGETLTNVAADGRFKDGVLELNGVSGTWRSASWRASGAVVTSSGEIEGMSLDAAGVPLRPALTLMGLGEHEVDGIVEVSAGISGSFERPTVDVEVQTSDLVFLGLVVEEAAAVGSFGRGTVDLAELRASLLGGSVSAEGRASRASADSEWEFTLFGDATELGLPDIVAAGGDRAAAGDSDAAAAGDSDVSGSVSLSEVTVRGTLRELAIESFLSWDDVTIGPLSLGDGVGGVIYENGGLSLSLGAADRGVEVSCYVDDLMGRPSVDALVSLERASLDSLLGAGDRPAIPVEVSGELRVDGPTHGMDLEGSLAVAGEDLSATLAMEGSVDASTGWRRPELRASVRSGDVSFRGVDGPISAEVFASADSVSIRNLSVGAFARGNLSLGLTGERRVAAGLVVSEAPLPDVLRLAFGTATDGVHGLVFASVSVRGSLDEPVAGVRLSVGNASVAGVDGLDAAVDLDIVGRDFTVSDLVFRHARRPVLTGQGEGRLGGSVQVALRGDGIPGPLLGGSRDTYFDATLGIGGRTDGLTLDGRIESDGPGSFLGVPFDSYRAIVSGADGRLRISHVVLELGDEYVATAEGEIPYDAVVGGEAEATLSIDVTGNPIALLGELSGAGRSGRGSGTLRAVVAGNRESFTVAQARLEARADRFWPASIFPRLDDLETSVHVVDGAVVSGSVTAKSGGSSIELRSSRDGSGEGLDLEPLVVGGVDVGVLALSTDDAGVAASIPGLMLPEEVGRVALRGKGGAREFLIGGPARSPFLWGEIEFSDLSFTYPFVEDEGAHIGSFISDAKWLIRMTAGRNLWYWRPDANLNVERGRSLDFEGSPADRTLCVSGRVTSNKGTLTYLHTEFDVREVSVDFPSLCEQPRFQVQAETRVADGTVISLSMNATEDLPVLNPGGVTLDESAIVLASDSPDDNTPEKIMSKLQYGVSYDLLEAEEQASLERRRAVELLGTQIGLRVTRPLLSPIESRIRRGLNLDLVRIDIDFVEHFFAQMDEWYAQEGTSQYSPFIADTRMTLGKYISGDWLLSYLGVVEPHEEEIGDQTLGLRSELGIEYEVSRNTSLSLRVVYDPSISGWDRRISIENRYDF
jgi:hypothetical protein